MTYSSFCSGETDSNKAGILQGQINTPLNETGVEQAELAGHVLKTTQLDDVYSSDLDRVRQTASEIVKRNDSLEGNLNKSTTFGERKLECIICFTWWLD